MTDFDRILAIKKAAQVRLRAIPGVHAVGIGAKVTGGQRTAEPSIIAYTVKKKALADLAPEEVIPSEIEGVKTDVVEAEIPHFHSTFPDTSSDYRSSGLDGGIQIQTGQTNYIGTLGCIAATDDPEPKIVAVTCHHVVVPTRRTPSLSTLKGSVSSDGHTVAFSGTNSAGLQVALTVNVVPTGAGTPSFPSVAYVTTAADTFTTIAAQIASQIVALANPGVTASTSGANLILTPSAGFTAKADLAINRLWGVLSNGLQTATLAGTIDPELLIDASLSVTLSGQTTAHTFDVFWVTSSGDSLGSIASALAGEINQQAPPGISVAASGTSITVTAAGGAAAQFNSCKAYPAHKEQTSADLKATVTATAINLTGRVSGDYYGVYTNVNAGGLTPSYGTFINPAKGMDLTSLAASIASSLTAIHVPGVTFSNSGPTITATNAEELECLITSDVRVGQAENDFSSACSDCCNDRIGVVLAARLEIDCALVKLDAGRKYKNEIQDIGIVTGIHQVTDAEAATPNTYAVQKRGRTTGPTNGTIAALHVDGDITGGPGLFARHYADAMRIQSTTPKPFSEGGDSGSAVLNSAKEVVGVLFGGGATHTLATPIDTVADMLEIIVQTATAPGNVLTVPSPASPHILTAAPPMPAERPSLLRTAVRARLREAEQQIGSTPVGRQYATLIRNHVPETRSLINTNRRVATVWHRSDGPKLVDAVLRTLHRRDRSLPAEIDGEPLVLCITRIQKVLMRYASPGLSASLREYAPRLAELGGLNYEELLTALRGAQAE